MLMGLRGKEHEQSVHADGSQCMFLFVRVGGCVLGDADAYASMRIHVCIRYVCGHTRVLV